jgi:hypothetical protein
MQEGETAGRWSNRQLELFSEVLVAAKVALQNLASSLGQQ